MTIDEYIRKNNIIPFDDVLDAIDLMKKYAQATNDSMFIKDTLELEKAHNQCHKCFSSWNYRGKQDTGWCYMFRDYMPNCEKYRDK